MKEQEHIKFVDQVTGLGFVQLPVAVLRDSRLSDGAIRTYCALLVYARQEQRCWPGLDRLAMDRGKSTRRITDHIAQLRAVGLIQTDRRPGTSQVYWILPLWNVYGQEDAPYRFTDAALGYCNLDEEGHIPRNQEVKVSKAPPSSAPVDMSSAVVAIAAAEKKAAAARDARAKKEMVRQAAKVDTKAAKVEAETGLTGHKLEMHWMKLYVAKWPKLPAPAWGAVERRTAKSIVTIYPELAFDACERVIVHWEECARRWGLDGQPTIRLVWGYRETLFAEVAQGLPPGGPKSAAMRADEFQTDGGSLEKIGW